MARARGSALYIFLTIISILGCVQYSLDTSYVRVTLADPTPRLCPDAVGSANVNGFPDPESAVGASSGDHREVVGQY